ncbi:Fe-S cluster assembly protein DRE2 like [Verticillium longisporum]|uniref:Uncharacterized protein n=2 Tax=Verticillium TaxID=1036719 RepID=A0A444S1Z1_VERDA|nr:Fe-S cluster assembly protein DRE2 like [Verticillium longisporum]PNH29565.1 hypothetical protein BJF96_g7122 [Verticillium dahliae]PNH38934.1 hypothetical protein VD0004_g7909 [Verticillium dahliae]PNH64201.1 hypothetical protein VD0001_g8918 [Verticillium dahliae]RXG47441.1 hypothetical protein VDGE_00117 [Verticillium dahliae]
MAPSFVTIDNTSDFDFTSPTTTATQPFQNGASSRRSLLLAPPSVASHPSALAAVLASHPRATTDLQMLDRLSAGLITLPEATYDLILILSDADGSRAESTPLLLNNRALFGQVAEALRPGGQLRAQEGGSAGALTEVQALTKEAVLSGLVADASGALAKPDYGDAGESVSLGLKFRKNKKSDAGPAVGAATVSLGGKPTTVSMAPPVQSTPAGVGFVNLDDDFGDDDDDDLIDEDTLLTEEDLMRPVNIPPECAPKAGKRRRACKDCSCGLAERLAAEDAAKRAAADAQLGAIQKQAANVKLAADDLAEVDFTVQGKVGSCGNCALGDAFRCDGCPYVGLPPFKPGEEVRLLNNEIQL